MKKLVFIFIAIGVLTACKKRYDEPVVGSIEKNAPGEVTYLQASRTSTLLELDWTDPTTSDLEEIEISFNNETHRVPKGIQYFALDNSSLNTYTFHVKTVDAFGNISKGVKLVNSIDYRLPFCGSYRFTHYQWFDDGFSLTNYPSEIYDGYVAIDKKSADQVIIRYKSGDNMCTCYNDSVYGGYFKPNVALTGVLTYSMITQLSPTSQLQGEFPNKDSVAFEFQINSIGHTSGQNVRGKKLH